MNIEEFEKDVKLAQKKYLYHKKVCAVLKILTLGLIQNKKSISKNLFEYEKCKSDYDKYRDLLLSAAELDSIEAITLEGVRVSKHIFSDILVINAAGYGIDWENLRDQVLSRDNYECQESDGYCKGPLQIHHQIPLSKGGTNRMENLHTLCLYHHVQKHEHMRNKYHGDLRS
jgi:hypothetical protein